jgi:hypothetical protein
MDDEDLEETRLILAAMRESILRSGRRRYRGRSNKKKEETKNDKTGDKE